MTWIDLQDRLRATLRSLTDRCYLVVTAPGNGGYVQFACLAEELSAEASGPNFVDGAAAHAATDPTMLAAGWTQPAQAQPNWTSVLPLPALTGEYAALADRCVVALRDVLHVADPAVLTYQAWRDAESQPTGVTWSPEQVERLEPGANPLLLPSLGLEPEPARG